jgi:hypothetical protein
MRSRLELTRSQVLGFRRSVGALDQRLAPGGRSLRRAAWAGRQDSMPRAALLSIQARVEGTHSSTWEDPSLVQLWGRGSTSSSSPAVDPRDARLELARRYLHIYGPHDTGGFRPVGGHPPAARRRRVSGAGQVAHAGAHPGRRRVGSSAATSRPSAPRRDLRHPLACSPAATPICCCSREPTGNSWSRTPTAVARCGPRVCGPVACSWMERSSASGGAPTRR